LNVIAMQRRHIPLRAVVISVLVGTGTLTCGETTGPDTGKPAPITSLRVTPALDTLTAFGATMTVTVHAFSGTLNHAPGSYTWTITDTTVAQLATFSVSDSTRTVQGWKNGSTFVRVREAGGATDSARIVVHQRAAAILASPSNAAFRGCRAQLHALPVDALNNAVPGAVLAWTSTDTTLARVDSAGFVTPRAAGVDTIVISSQGVTKRVALVIQVAATPTFQASGSYAPATAVGVAQYVLGYGNITPTFPYYLAPARFRVVSSDTTILNPAPADTEGYLSSTWLLAGPVRLVGRAVGNVTLTPYLCDAAGPAVSFPVTRSKLKLFSTLDSTARTDDPVVTLNVRTQDSTGAVPFIAVPLTVRNTATDTNVIRADSAYRHVPVGADQSYMSFSFADSGRSRIVLRDSSGIFLPDSSPVIHVRYPPLFIFSEGASVGDTIHIGQRQKPFYDVYRAKVGLDRFVAGTPLRVDVSSSDSLIARASDSLVIPVGASATTAAFDITARDTRGTAIITAHAYRHRDDQVAIVVGRPAAQLRGPGPYQAIYPGDAGYVQIFAVDSETGMIGFPTESVTFVVTTSDTSIVQLDSTTVTVPAGDYYSTLSGITFKKPGTVTITASDPRIAPYAYASGTTDPFTILQPYLDAVPELSLGIGQSFGYWVNVNGRLGPGDVVHLAHRNPAVAGLADSTLAASGMVVATGLAAGVDTVIVTAPGFTPDTGMIVVGPGMIGLAYWPPGALVAGQTWSPPTRLEVFAPSGDARVTTTTIDFTLAPNANIEFIKNGVPITTMSVLAGQHSSDDFSIRAKTAGTGSATFSAPNYTPLTRTVTITP
jgi:hypothetical protein